MVDLLDLYKLVGSKKGQVVGQNLLLWMSIVNNYKVLSRIEFVLDIIALFILIEN